MSTYVTHRNDRPATAGDLAPLAFAGFAHFTAMQVRDRAVRGLDLHLERLRAASLTLFGRALPDERVLAAVRSALAGAPADLSLTVTVFSPAGEFVVADPEPELLVRTAPPSDGPEGPLSLAAVEHERALPGIKHVGESAKTHHLREAVARGFDDAAFVDRHGRLTEATIWNLVFWDGTTVVWPQAEMLTGTMMGVVRRRLAAMGVPQRTQEITVADLPAFTGAAVMNSWTPGVEVDRVEETRFTDGPALRALLHQAHASETPTPL